MTETRIAFVASEDSEAQEALAELAARYGNVDPVEAGIIVALGGDGFMLQTLHAHIGRDVPIYGMNRGSVGFLMNRYDEDDVPARLARAEPVRLHPLRPDRRVGAAGRLRDRGSVLAVRRRRPRLRLRRVTARGIRRTGADGRCARVPLRRGSRGPGREHDAQTEAFQADGNARTPRAQLRRGAMPPAGAASRRRALPEKIRSRSAQASGDQMIFNLGPYAGVD